MDYGDVQDAEDETVGGVTELESEMREKFYDDLLNEDTSEAHMVTVMQEKGVQYKPLSTIPSGSVWGTGTDPSIHCWWCCHTFKTTPVSIPCSYNEKRNKWKFFGIFCSPACARSYTSKEIRNGDMGVNSALLTKFLKEHYDLPPPYGFAPARISLKMFGGPFTISQFRKMSASCKCEVLVPPHEPIVTTLSVRNSQKRVKLETRKTEEPPRPAPPEPPPSSLKLKRKKPAQKGNILETMNIKVR